VLERDASGTPVRDKKERLVTKKIPFADPAVIREIIARL
jgi:hypothetical protein